MSLTPMNVPVTKTGGATPTLQDSDVTNNLGVSVTVGVPMTINGAPFPQSYVKCSNTQASGTGGGTSTSGSWQTMPLNTKDNDVSNIATLISNAITLPAGTYRVSASCPIYGSNSGTQAQLRLFNSTASLVLINGQNSENNEAGDVGALSLLSGMFTLSVPSTVILQYSTNASTINGLGFPYSFGTEVYAQIEFIKVG